MKKNELDWLGQPKEKRNIASVRSTSLNSLAVNEEEIQEEKEKDCYPERRYL